MDSTEFWHWVALAAIAILMGVISFFASRTAKQLDGKVDRDEFKQFLDETSQSRGELRDSIIKLFDSLKMHEEKDTLRFEILTKDFNGGMARLTEVVNKTTLDLLREINGKQDKGRGR